LPTFFVLAAGDDMGAPGCSWVLLAVPGCFAEVAHLLLQRLHILLTGLRGRQHGNCCVALQVSPTHVESPSSTKPPRAARQPVRSSSVAVHSRRFQHAGLGKGTRNMLSAHAPARKQELQSHEFHTAKEKETGGAALSLIGVDESGRSIGRCSAAVINKGCKRATNL